MFYFHENFSLFFRREKISINFINLVFYKNKNHKIKLSNVCSMKADELLVNNKNKIYNITFNYKLNTNLSSGWELY